MNFKKTYITFLLVFVLPAFSVVFGQHIIPVKKAQVSTEINFNEILDVEQDKYGFLWIGTDEGLYRFNGSQYEFFSQDKNDSTKLQHHYINKIHKDNNQNLWIGSFYGLHKYHPLSNTFSHFAPDPENYNWLRGKFINDIAEDEKGNLWLATYRGLTFFDVSKNILKTYDPSNSKLPTRDISCLETAKNGLLIGTKKHGVWILKDGVFSEYFNRLPDDELIWDILYDRDKNLWIATESSGVFLVSGKNEKITRFLEGAVVKRLETLGNNDDIVFGGKIWIRETEKSEPIQFVVNQKISNAGWQFVYKTSNGITWIFTTDGAYLLNDKTLFYSLPENALPKNKNNLQTVTAIHMEFLKTFFKISDLGTFVYNYETEKTSLINHNSYIWEYKNPISLCDTQIPGINREGFALTDIEQKNTRLIKKGSYRFYFIDNEGWINLIANTDEFSEIEKYHPEKEVWKTEKVKTKMHQVLPQMGIIGCKMTSDSTWWLMSVEGETAISGLFRKKKEEQSFSFVARQKEKTPNVFIHDICLGPDGRYYLATEAGLSILDSVNNSILPFPINTKKKYSIKALVSDQQNNLWLTTSEGLFRLNVYTETLDHFGKNNGLPDETFQLRASTSDENGNIFFGHNKGFSWFFPDSLRISTQALNIVISEFSYLDKSQKTIYFPAEQNSPIQLRNSSSEFQFNFLSPMQDNSYMQSFQYKIKGYDTCWIKTNDISTIYKKLPKGKELQFIVQHLSENEKLLSEASFVFEIKRNWHYLNVVPGLIALLFMAFVFSRLRKRQKRKIDTSLLKQRISEDELLQKLNKLIDKNLANGEFGSTEIEKELGISRSSLFRHMKDKTGMSVTAYIRDYRLEKANELLATRKYTVSEIIHVVGFNSRSYFYRCFKDKFGENPTAKIQ